MALIVVSIVFTRWLICIGYVANVSAAHMGQLMKRGTNWFLLISPHAPPCQSGFPGRQIEAMKGAPHLVSKARGQTGTKVVPNAGNIS